MTSNVGDPTVQEDELSLSGSILQKGKLKTSSLHERWEIKIDDEMASKMGDPKEQENPFVSDSVLGDPKGKRTAEELSADESETTDEDSSGSAFDDSTPCHSADEGKGDGEGEGNCIHNYSKDRPNAYPYVEFENEKERKRWYRMEKQIHKSECFFLDSRLRPRRSIGGIFPLHSDHFTDLNDAFGGYINDGLKYAIEVYNEEEKTKLELEQIIYVNMAGFTYYITFLGKLGPSDEPLTYQAKVEYYQFSEMEEAFKKCYFVRREPENVNLLKRLQKCGQFLQYRRR